MKKNKGLLYHRKDKVNKHARGYHAEEGTSVETVNCRACARNQGSRRLALRVAAPTEGPAKTTREVGSDITWRRRQSAIENAPKHRNDWESIEPWARHVVCMNTLHSSSPLYIKLPPLYLRSRTSLLRHLWRISSSGYH